MTSELLQIQLERRRRRHVSDGETRGETRGGGAGRGRGPFGETRKRERGTQMWKRVEVKSPLSHRHLSPLRRLYSNLPREESCLAAQERASGANTQNHTGNGSQTPLVATEHTETDDGDGVACNLRRNGKTTSLAMPTPWKWRRRTGDLSAKMVVTRERESTPRRPLGLSMYPPSPVQSRHPARCT